MRCRRFGAIAPRSWRISMAKRAHVCSTTTCVCCFPPASRSCPIFRGRGLLNFATRRGMYTCSAKPKPPGSSRSIGFRPTRMASQRSFPSASRSPTARFSFSMKASGRVRSASRASWTSAAQTSAKFIAHPFSDMPGTRLYRTGDWARLNADGQIEFVGRRDQQVKLRGFRVELGEIEAALAGHPAIRECAVVSRNDTNGEKRLIAYFVTEGATPSVSELRAFMSGQLLDYMVPPVFLKLDALPLSANGKVNRLALPNPDSARPELAAGYVAPRTAPEKLLAEIWSEVLRIDQVGTDDNFFELSGNSLLATLVCSRVRKALKLE